MAWRFQILSNSVLGEDTGIPSRYELIGRIPNQGRVTAAGFQPATDQSEMYDDHIMSHPYRIPAGISETELVVKKSRFIARASMATTREEAMEALARMRADFPDAGHHCWAYILGMPEQAASAAMSDDGEPSGTAGKPILNVLKHKDVGDIMLVIARYFGGIKLGAGGLVRAYSGAAQQLMDEINVVEHVVRSRLEIVLDHADEQALRHWLDNNDGILVSTDYQQRVRCTIEILEDSLESLNAQCGARAWQLYQP